MRQRSALVVLVLAACARAVVAADVAIVKSSDALAWRPAVDALRRAAPAHAYSEFDLRGDRAEAQRVISTFKGKGTILVAMGALAAQVAREVAPDSPMVFCMVQDPARMGLLQVPNVAGVAFSIPIKNQLAAFRTVNPRGVRIGVIFNPDNVGTQVQEAQRAAGVVRLAVLDKPVSSEKEIPQALRSLLKGDTEVDALWMPPDPLLLSDESRRYILVETLKAGKPVYSFSAAIVQEGALVSDGPDFTSIGKQAAELVNRLAAGERKIDLLIPRAELVINKKIADKLKIDVPAEALKAADKVL